MSVGALTPPPKPPGLGFYVQLLAVLLELGMLTCFIRNDDGIGVTIWLVYVWFSALRDMVERLFDRIM